MGRESEAEDRDTRTKDSPSQPKLGDLEFMEFDFRCHRVLLQKENVLRYSNIA